MKAYLTSIKGFIEEQSKRWEKILVHSEKSGLTNLPTITICMEAGSGGSLVAKRVAENMGFDRFHREMIQSIAESGHLNPEVLAAMEKERPSGIQDFISSLLNDRYLWPGVYLDHLYKVIKALADRGTAVIVGRGANFILSTTKCLRVRVIAPLEHRINNIANHYKVTQEAAKRRILNRDMRRKAFIHKSFNTDISDAVHQDLIVNTGTSTIEEAADVICSSWCNRFLRAPKR